MTALAMRNLFTLHVVEAASVTNKYYSQTCLKQKLKRRQVFFFKTGNRLIQVKSIAECSRGAFCNTFDLH